MNRVKYLIVGGNGFNRGNGIRRSQELKIQSVQRTMIIQVIQNNKVTRDAVRQNSAIIRIRNAYKSRPEKSNNGSLQS